MMTTAGRSWLLISSPIALMAIVAIGLSARANAAAPTSKAKKPAAPKKVSRYEEIRLTDPKDPTKPLKDAPEWKTKKTTLLTEGKFSEGEAAAAEERAFNDHYRLVIAEMSQAEYADRLAARHSEIKKELNGYGRAPEKTLHAKLRDMLIKALPKLIANDKYSPEARANWLLILGDLNNEEGDMTGNGAVPLQAALPELLKIVKNQDPKQKYPLYLQPIALVGVTRHLQSQRNSFAADQKRDLARTMAAWLQKPPVEGQSPDVHNFLRRRATEVIRMLARGPEAGIGEVTEGLQAVAADDSAPLEVRCDAVRTLGVIEGKNLPEKTVTAAARTVAALAAEIAQLTDAPDPPPDEEAETEVAADAPAADAPAAPDAAGPDAAVVAAAAPPKAAETADDEKAETNSRGQNPLAPELQTYFLRCLLVGIDGADTAGKRGLAAAATAENKQLITDLRAKVEEMVNLVKSKKKTDKLTDVEGGKMRTLATAIETLVNPNRQARAQ